jgi:hypothetical protein
MSAIEAISIKGQSDEDFDDKMTISEMASEIAPMASSAAAMDKKSLEEELIKLRLQLMLAANQKKRTGRRRRIRSTTLRFFWRPRISSRISTPWTCRQYSLWWVEQTLNERKTHLDFKHAGLVSYKNNVWRRCQTNGRNENERDS